MHKSAIFGKYSFSTQHICRGVVMACHDAHVLVRA